MVEKVLGNIVTSRLVFIVCVMTFLVAGLTSSFGQQAIPQRDAFGHNPAVSVKVANITGAPGQTIPMHISVAGAAEHLRALVMVRGIPSQFKLSSGFLNGDSRLVSLAELKTLRLIVPADFEGRFDIEVTFVLVESNRKQTRSASVTIQREGQLKDRLLVLEEGKQTQTRSASGIILPKRQTKDRHQPVKASAQAKPAASPPTPEPGRSAGIICQGAAQVQNDGRLINTPYCQDGYLAEVAQSYGVRTSAQQMRYDLAEKSRVCRFIGDDIRVRTACGTYGQEGLRRR